jgi:hypothetical protein
MVQLNKLTEEDPVIGAHYFSTLLILSLICRAGWAAGAVTLEIRPDVEFEVRAGPHVLSDVSRSRYFRTYHIPGMYSEERAQELKSLGVSPARGTGPYLGSRGGDLERAAWDASLEAQFVRYAEMYRKAEERYPGQPHAMAGGTYPASAKKAAEAKVQVDATMTVKHNEGFTAEDFSANAALIDRWLTVIREGGGSLPGYFSPMNEPDAAWKSSPNPPQDHADFARALAIQLKEKHPDVLISGPCTAWAHLDAAMNRWNKSGWERRFIETAGDVAGAYDFHFYSKEYWAYSEESPGFGAANKLAKPNLYEGLKSGNPFVWDFGKVEAYLDLVYAHHQSVWGKPSLPVIITEFGRQGITPQRGPWASEYLHYLYGTTVTRLWMGFMDRPEIELTVPFILPESDRGHSPQRGQALYTRPGAPGNMALEPTPLLGFYEFFKGFAGERVFCRWQGLDSAQALGLFAIAVRNGDEVQILLHNSFSEPLEIGLKLAAEAGVSGGRIARMRWEGAEPAVYNERSDGRWRIDRDAGEPCDLSKLVLSGEETAVVKFSYSPVKPEKMICERFYSAQTLLPLDTPAEFIIHLPDAADCESSALTLSLSAAEGLASGDFLSLKINDYDALPVDLGFTSGMRCMMVPVRIELPAKTLRSGENRVSVKLNAGSPRKDVLVSTIRIDRCLLDF